MDLTKDEKEFLRQVVGEHLEKFKKEGHVAQEFIAVLAAEEKYEHFLEDLYKKLGGSSSDGHE